MFLMDLQPDNWVVLPLWTSSHKNPFGIGITRHAGLPNLPLYNARPWKIRTLIFGYVLGKKKVENKEKRIHKPNVNSIKTHLFHEILDFPEGNRCPAGIRYFSSFAILRAFNRTSNGRIARPLFLFSVIQPRRSVSSPDHAAFLPRFARLSQGIFSKFSLLFLHNLTLLLETPNFQERDFHVVSRNWWSVIYRTQCNFDALFRWVP